MSLINKKFLPISPALNVISLSSAASKSYNALAFFSSFLGLLDEDVPDEVFPPVATEAPVAPKPPYRELDGYKVELLEATDAPEINVIK